MKCADMSLLYGYVMVMVVLAVWLCYRYVFAV